MLASIWPSDLTDFANTEPIDQDILAININIIPLLSRIKDASPDNTKLATPANPINKPITPIGDIFFCLRMTISSNAIKSGTVEMISEAILDCNIIMRYCYM